MTNPKTPPDSNAFDMDGQQINDLWVTRNLSEMKAHARAYYFRAALACLAALAAITVTSYAWGEVNNTIAARIAAETPK